MKVACPTCNADVEWTNTSTFRPFCSKRCQVIDLGDWAEGQHAIAEKPSLDPGVINEMTDEELNAYLQSLHE
jgi:endogenous inhibitor of DNA gyrase (YacG/DUF329 family)